MFQCKAGLGINVLYDSTYVSVQGRAGNECTLRLYLCFSARPGWEWMYSTTLLMFQCKAGLGMNVLYDSTYVSDFQCKAGLGMNVLYDSTYVSVQGRAGNECTLRLSLCFSARPGWEWMYSTTLLMFQCKAGLGMKYCTTLLMFQCKAGLRMNVPHDSTYVSVQGRAGNECTLRPAVQEASQDNATRPWLQRRLHVCWSGGTHVEPSRCKSSFLVWFKTTTRSHHSCYIHTSNDPVPEL